MIWDDGILKISHCYTMDFFLFQANHMQKFCNFRHYSVSVRLVKVLGNPDFLFNLKSRLLDGSIVGYGLRFNCFFISNGFYLVFAETYTRISDYIEIVGR